MNKIKKIKTIQERKIELYEEEIDEEELKAETIDDICNKINEIVEVINREIK